MKYNTERPREALAREPPFAEVADGLWQVYFGPLKLGRFEERQLRIVDEYGNTAGTPGEG